MSIWISEEQRYADFLYTTKFPSKELEYVDFAIIKNNHDLKSVPNTSGVYFIWTNEPLTHAFNAGLNPSLFNGGRIMYNGVSTTLEDRCRTHLLSKIEQGGPSGSAISVDLYTGDKIPVSHVKAAWCKNKKLPYVSGKKVTQRNNLLGLGNLSTAERNIILTGKTSIWFENGIDVEREKHAIFEWRFYFIPLKLDSYKDFIERQWRKIHGAPQLCSYTSGR